MIVSDFYYVKEWVEKNAGKEAIVASEAFYSTYEYSEFIDKSIGRIVGYTNAYRYVLVEPNQVGIKIFGEGMVISEITTYFSSPFKKFIMFHPNSIKIFEAKVKIIPYPHHCKICHSSARKCGNFIICSNLNCKSRKQLKKYVVYA